MSNSLKQLVDATIKQKRDAIHRIDFNPFLFTEDERTAAIKKIRDEADAELYKAIATCIIEATTKKDPAILHNLFGSMAHKEYCSKAQIKELEESLHKDPELYSIYVYKFYNSLFLAFGFYYACYKGVLPLIRYYLEQQPFMEDMGNIMVNVRGLEKHFPDTPVLNGPPLKLATISNEVSCVEYLYENTEAMAEGECEDFSDRRSNLEIATTNKNALLVRFLLSHAADPNAPASENSFTSTFDLALKTLDLDIIMAYVDAGALITRQHIHTAISMLATLPILQLLFARCINKEDLKKPYLLTAVGTGNIQYLELIESLPNVSSWQTLFAYHEDPLHTQLVHTATSSGSLAMLQHVAEQHHIDVKTIVQADIAEFEAQVQSGHLKYESNKATLIASATLIHKAADNMPLVQFFCETFEGGLSEEALKQQCKYSDTDLRANSYFLSQMKENEAKKEELRKLAIDFDVLPLIFLCRMFNTPLILSGNPFAHLVSKNHNYIPLIAKIIQNTTEDMDIAAIYNEINQDFEALKGALFYFCTELFEKDTQSFIDFFTMVQTNHAISVDEVNSLGTTLAHFAYQQQNHAVVEFLISLGANPDKPNQEGKTLLTEGMKGYYHGEGAKKKALTYIEEHMCEEQVGHSLVYKLGKDYFFHAEDVALLLTASKGTLAPVSVDALIAAVMTRKEGHVRSEGFVTLFTNLAELHAIRLVQRLRQPKTIEGIQAEALTEEFQCYLQQFEKAKGLAPEQIARRLAKLPTASSSAAFFVYPSGGPQLLQPKVDESTTQWLNSMD
jgi:ankyrin repeat protein